MSLGTGLDQQNCERWDSIVDPWSRLDGLRERHRMSHRGNHQMRPGAHHGTDLFGIGPLGRLEGTVVNVLDCSVLVAR